MRLACRKLLTVTLVTTVTLTITDVTRTRRIKKLINMKNYCAVKHR